MSRSLRPLAAVLLLVVAGRAPAQVPSSSARASEPAAGQAAPVVDPASPRAAVAAFRAAVRRNDLSAAAAQLEFADAEARAAAPELARRLDVVLESRLWLELDRLSGAAAGDTADGLAADREQVGTVPDADQRAVPIVLVRRMRDGRPTWVFSAGSVAQVNALFDALPDAWVREHLPEALRRLGPLGVQWWQWLALLTLIPLAAAIGWLLAGPVQSLLKRLVSRTETDLDDVLVASARGPIVLLVGVTSSRVLLRWIALPGPAERFVVDLQRAIAVVAVFWILLRVIGVLQQALPATAWGTSHPALRSLIPLGGRIARLLVLVFGLLTVVASFGYPIATILAGLGIGGIAVALGAQKSLEHFFGSVSIGVDQPFRVGDWVLIDGVEGEIEAIGLRSTRVRTLERTVVSFPNGRLADQRSENFGPRDRIRFRTDVALEYGTTAAQVQQVRDGVEALLRAHPLTWPGRVVVRFARLGASALELECFCWVLTTDADDFRRVREEHLLGILRVVERAGATLAFPTQTVVLRQPAERAPTAGR